LPPPKLGIKITFAHFRIYTLAEVSRLSQHAVHLKIVAIQHGICCLFFQQTMNALAIWLASRFGLDGPMKRSNALWHRVGRSQIGLVLTLSLVLRAAAASAAGSYEPSTVIPPKLAREMRGAWIATVGNLAWPSRKGLSTAEQKAELIAMLDRAAQLKLNTLIFQVRPCSDAIYESTFEPWSEYLSGTMGKAPLPFYDPLSFAVQEAHSRGLELHACLILTVPETLQTPGRLQPTTSSKPIHSGSVATAANYGLIQAKKMFRPTC
jgi:uncharacterized lipoprotein YddW (UPF0748 family)